MRHLTVDEESAVQLLDNFLIRELKGVPKTHIYRIIRSGEVRRNKGRVGADDRVQAGDVLLVIESMKMEFNLLAPANATVHSLMCAQGGAVSAGQNVLVLIDEVF